MNQFTLTFFFFIISIISTYSQVDSLDYSKFKMPDIVRKELIFNTNFSNFNTYQRVNDTLLNSEKNNEFYLSNNYNIDYLRTKNSRKYQGTQQVSFYSFYQINNSENDSIGIRNKYVYSNIYLSGKNRMYFNKKLFYELNYYVSYANIFNKAYSIQSNVNQFSSYYSQHTYSLNPSFAIGIGRIEPITEVVHAIEYIKNLKKEKRLSKDFNEESIFEFAKLMIKTKNERFFDNRKKKIYELEKVDSFLISNHYVTNNDIRYFSVIDDIWEFAGNFPRYSGKRISFIVNPDYDVLIYHDLAADSGEFIISRRLNTTPYLSFSLSKPINAIVQRDLFANLGYRYSTLVLTRDSTYRGTSQWLINFGISYGFYPNTRTYLESSFNLLYTRVVNGNKDELSGYLGIKTYYYIAPRLRFFTESDINLIDVNLFRGNESSRYTRYNIRAGIQFTFF